MRDKGGSWPHRRLQEYSDVYESPDLDGRSYSLLLLLLLRNTSNNTKRNYTCLNKLVLCKAEIAAI